MQIQLRVRTNDVPESNSASQFVRNAFVLYDNCVEIKYGTRMYGVSKEEFALIYPKKLYDIREAAKTIYWHPENHCPFDDVIHMLRDIDATEERIAKDSSFRGKTRVSPDKVKDSTIEYAHPYHYNVIEWKDRVTNKHYRLFFDTVVWINDDSGRTIRKIEG